ncbi:MAG: hypothetical protein K2Q18_08780 [Bdellovibrionales bacterium]|nr:hypothetical protein [Bdellovibrionales bacterium]
MSSEKILDRYKHENNFIIIEVSVRNLRQIFNERDPAPFRARDLDPQFVIYLVSSIEEFPLRVKMKIRILSADIDDINSEKNLEAGEAIRAYFLYESQLIMAKLRKRHRTARYFFLIGLITLICCLSLANLIDSLVVFPRITNFANVSLIIIGWVAMWHPVEALLYDWWPIREQRQYFDKIALLDVEVVGMDPDGTS